MSKSKYQDLTPWLDYLDMLQWYEQEGFLQMNPKEHEAYITRAALLTLLGAHGEPDGLMPVWAARLSEPGVSWKLRTMKSQWGSCNWRKRLITLNAELARMARDLVEYVVVHEFTHLQAHDHGPGFRALMDARLPDWRARRRRLSGLGI